MFSNFSYKQCNDMKNTKFSKPFSDSARIHTSEKVVTNWVCYDTGILPEIVAQGSSNPVLEGHYPAEFSSCQTYQNKLIKVFRVIRKLEIGVLDRSELNSAGQ